MSDSLLIMVVTVSAAFVFMFLERLWPYDKQKVFRKGWFLDLFWYTAIQSLVLGYVIKHLVLWVDASVGASRLQLLSGWPIWCQVMFFFVTHDLYIYWFHRLQHSNRYLWRTHEAHHSVQNVDWLAGSRSHAVEIAINQTIEFMPIYLLGAAPAVLIYKALMDAVWGMYIHANLNVKSGWLQKVINGPEMHRWHHSRDVYDTNFATKIAAWDWIFGTAYLPENQKPSGYGLAEEDFPLVKEGQGELGGAIEFVRDKKDPLQLVTYLKQQLAMFRPLRRKDTA